MLNYVGSTVIRVRKLLERSSVLDRNCLPYYETWGKHGSFHFERVPGFELQKINPPIGRFATLVPELVEGTRKHFAYLLRGLIRGPGLGATRCGTGLQSTVNPALSENFTPSGYTTSSLVHPW